MTQFMRHSGGVGISDLLKDGSKHFSGVDEAVLKNIEACKKLSMITRTSIGPNGMNKMVVNHLGKLLVTNDAATIVKEMEVWCIFDIILRVQNNLVHRGMNFCKSITAVAGCSSGC